MFLFYVPILPLYTALVILPITILMFCLGVHLGSMIAVQAKPASLPGAAVPIPAQPIKTARSDRGMAVPGLRHG